MIGIHSKNHIQQLSITYVGNKYISQSLVVPSSTVDYEYY